VLSSQIKDQFPPLHMPTLVPERPINQRIGCPYPNWPELSPTTSIFRHFINEIRPFVTLGIGAGFASHPITCPIVTEILLGPMARDGVDLSHLP
jgi:hypothetical protein